MFYFWIFLWTWFGFELLIMVSSGGYFRFTRLIAQKLALFVLGKKSCSLDIHDWKYKSEYFPIVESDIERFVGTDINLYTRTCARCEKKQLSFHHPENRQFKGFVDTRIETGAPIELKISKRV